MALKQSAKYKEALNSDEAINYKNYKIQMPGVYEGFQASKISNTSIQLTSGNLFIDADNAKVSIKVEQDNVSTHAVTNLTPYLVCSFSYIKTLVNVPVFNAKSEASLLETDVIICKCVYSGATLNGFDYSFRTFGNLKDENISVDAISSSDLVYVMPSTNFWYINSIQTEIKYINEKVKVNYGNNTALPANNYYLVASVSAGVLTYSVVQAISTNPPLYSYSRLGWYLTGGDIEKRVLCKYYWTGSVSTILAIYTQEFAYLEGRGYSDTTVAKNLSSSVNWNLLTDTGEYNISGASQTSAPDSSTSKQWTSLINNKGASGSTFIGSQFATDLLNNRTYLRSSNAGTFTAWRLLNSQRTTTITIASGYSSSIGQQSADYVCTGTNDHLTIQAAIASLSGTYGGEIVLLEGDYDIRGTITMGINNVSIRGQGIGITTLKKNLASTTVANMITVSGNHIKLSNFTLDGNFTLSTGEVTGITGNASTTVFFDNIESKNHRTTTGTNVFDFYNCYNLSNCKAYNSTGGSGGNCGFYTCYQLVNCEAANANAGINNYGFYSCYHLTECIGNITGGTTAKLGFYLCSMLENCKGSAVGTTASSNSGFSNCVYLTNCEGIATGVTANNYSFNACTQLSNCKATASGGSTNTTFFNCSANWVGSASRSSSLVVAAYNSSLAGRLAADYVCDGVDDYVQINAAINALTSGGEVVLLEGNYNISTAINQSINITNYHIHLRGQGRSTIINTTSYISITASANRYPKLSDFTLTGTVNTGGGYGGISYGIYVPSTGTTVSNIYMDLTATDNLTDIIGFFDTRITSDCTFIGTNYRNITGFKSCDNMINCSNTSTCTGSAAYESLGILSCTKVSYTSSTTVSANGGGASFKSCIDVSHCIARDTDSSNAISSYGMWDCFRVSFCDSLGVSAGPFQAIGYHTCYVSATAIAGAKIDDGTSNDFVEHGWNVGDGD